MEDQDPESPHSVEYPINGVLDLHGFNPKEVKDLVAEYLFQCRHHGILRVRIIHGKGIGSLRQTVHTILAKTPGVMTFSLAPAEFGHWGATIVHLKPQEP